MPSSLAALSCDSGRSSSTRFTSTASCTFSFSSFASGKPRSAKTFPLPASTLILFFAIARLVILLRCPYTLTDERDVLAGGADAGWRFLLKGMQHVSRLRKLNRINRPVRSAWLGARWLLTVPDHAQVITHGPDHARGETEQISLRRANPVKRLLVRRWPSSHGDYTESGMRGRVSSFNDPHAARLTKSLI